MSDHVRDRSIIFTLLCAVLLMIGASPVSSAESYWGTSLAVPGTDDHTDDRGTNTTFNRAFRVDLAIGFDDVNPITDRIEFEFAYRKADVNEISRGLITERVDGDVSYFAAFNNWYHDMDYLSFRYGNRWTPYVGAGYGYASVQANGIAADSSRFNTVDDSDEVYIYQGMTGLEYAYSPYTVVTLGYRYTESNRDDQVTWTDSGGNTIKAGHVTDHQFEIGFRWRFF